MMNQDREALDQRLYDQTKLEPGRKQVKSARTDKHVKDMAEMAKQLHTPYRGGPTGAHSRGWSGGVPDARQDTIVDKPTSPVPSSKTLENKAANRMALAEELASVMAQSGDPTLTAHATAFLRAKGKGRSAAVDPLIEAYNQSPLAMSKVAQ